MKGGENFYSGKQDYYEMEAKSEQVQVDNIYNDKSIDYYELQDNKRA